MTNRETWRIKSKPGDLTGLRGDELMEISSCKHVLDFFLDLLTHFVQIPPFYFDVFQFYVKNCFGRMESIGMLGKTGTKQVNSFQQGVEYRNQSFLMKIKWLVSV